MSSREISRVMGIGKRAPSARRRLSTTLVKDEFLREYDDLCINVPVVVRLVHETLERAESTVHDELEVA